MTSPGFWYRSASSKPSPPCDLRATPCATCYNLFYGLHSTVARQDRAGQRAGGWRPDQRVTREEAVRGFTTWAAYTAFRENQTGLLAPGRWADVTVLSLDPFTASPSALLGGTVTMTIVGGRIVD